MFVEEHHPTANGAMWQAIDTSMGGEGSCYAIFNAFKIKANPTYRTCFFAGERRIMFI